MPPPPAFPAVASVEQGAGKTSLGPVVLTAASHYAIGVVAYNRPEMLNECLTSLLKVRGVEKGMVVVYQDGTMPSVAAVAQKHGVRVVQETGRPKGNEGAEDIAAHYKWTFKQIFNAQPAPDYSIVVEDDMIFSADFFDFFRQLTPVLDSDPTLWCISSWNDNAMKGLVKPDPTKVYRTDFFLGLGWLMRRDLFQNELEASWPPTHWDHWMRQPEISKGRECLFPQIPRNHNIGKIGVHSDEELYNRYFRDVAFNTDPSPVLGNVAKLKDIPYDQDIRQRIAKGFRTTSLGQLRKPGLIAPGQAAVVAYQAPHPADVFAMEAEWKPVSEFFKAPLDAAHCPCAC